MNQLNANSGDLVDLAVQGADSLNKPAGFPHRLVKLAKLTVAPEIIRSLPAEFAKRHALLPF